MSIIENENLKGEQKVELTVAEEMERKTYRSRPGRNAVEIFEKLYTEAVRKRKNRDQRQVRTEKKRKATAGDIVITYLKRNDLRSRLRIYLWISSMRTMSFLL